MVIWPNAYVKWPLVWPLCLLELPYTYCYIIRSANYLDYDVTYNVDNAYDIKARYKSLHVSIHGAKKIFRLMNIGNFTEVALNSHGALNILKYKFTRHHSDRRETNVRACAFSTPLYTAQHNLSWTFKRLNYAELLRFINDVTCD